MSTLYEILEVETSASGSEIKRAYRKLALRYHPDKVSEEDRESSETKFKEISHAYETLADEKKREEYDLYGSAEQQNYDQYDFGGTPFDNFYGGAANEYGADDFFNFFLNGGRGGANGGQARKERTEDAELEVEVTLEDLYKGKTIRTTSTRNIICSRCKGSGCKKHPILKKCGTCDGEGSVTKIHRVAPGYINRQQVECSKCEGSGKVSRPKDHCKKCLGTKVMEETKILEFEIARGSRSGETIILEKESDEYPGKITGDIRLTFHCKDHISFTRSGDDLFAKYKIPLVDSLCGFSKVLVKHLDGRGIKIATKRGQVIRPGQYILIRNEGMPLKESSSWFGQSTLRKGDLYIEIDIEFPQDNWYLEKNDLLKMKNLLPSDLQSKSDINRQAVDDDSLLDENIEVVTDFTLTRDPPRNE